MPVGRRGELPVWRATRSLGAMLGVVRPVAETFMARFSDMEHPPEEISLDSGISLTAEADILIATASEAKTWRP